MYQADRLTDDASGVVKQSPKEQQGQGELEYEWFKTERLELAPLIPERQMNVARESREKVPEVFLENTEQYRQESEQKAINGKRIRNIIILIILAIFCWPIAVIFAFFLLKGKVTLTQRIFLVIGTTLYVLAQLLPR
jgi:hypothetical protein